MLSADTLQLPSLTPVSSPGSYERLGGQIVAKRSKIDFAVFDCYEIPQTASSDSAERVLEPASAIGLIRRKTPGFGGPFIDPSSVLVHVVTSPRHGKLSTEKGNDGEVFFTYDPAPGYLGKDVVVFDAIANGKRYHVTSTIAVVQFAPQTKKEEVDDPDDETQCPRDRIKAISSGRVSSPSTLRN